MAQIKFANNVSTQLAKPITKDSTTIEVRSLTLGLTWPELTSQGDYFLIVIDDLDTSRWEILKCTNVEIRSNETVLTVERGLEGTVAADFNAGAVVENRLTAGTINNFATGLPDIVPLTRGGTQADNPVDARTNLEIYSKTEVDAKETALQEQIKSSMPPDASTTVKGIVQLSNAVASDSEILASTSKATKLVHDLAIKAEVDAAEAKNAADAAQHTADAAQHTADAASIKTESASKLVTARNITLTGATTGSTSFDGSVDVLIDTTIVDASTTFPGIVQLSSAVDSESETLAATPKAVKMAYDKAIAAEGAMSTAGVVGEYKIAHLNNISGYLLCNGAAISRTTYAKLFSILGTTFGAGDGVTTFNIPDFRGRTLWGSSGNLGARLNAGLPNITGNLNHSNSRGSRTGNAIESASGAFSVYGAATGTNGNILNNTNAYISFNAAASNPIYGSSTTVQPPAITVNVFIKY